MLFVSLVLSVTNEVLQTNWAIGVLSEMGLTEASLMLIIQLFQRLPQ